MHTPRNVGVLEEHTMPASMLIYTAFFLGGGLVFGLVLLIASLRFAEWRQARASRAS